MNRAVLVTVGLTLLALEAVAATDQWPMFRGVQAGVVADDPTLPDTWSETENIAWKVPIPGLGWSSPVVWNDHVFLTSAISSGNEPAAKAASRESWVAGSSEICCSRSLAIRSPSTEERIRLIASCVRPPVSVADTE